MKKFRTKSLQLVIAHWIRLLFLEYIILYLHKASNKLEKILHNGYTYTTTELHFKVTKSVVYSVRYIYSMKQNLAVSK